MLTTLEQLTQPVETGEIVTACAISAANLLRDVREHITNTFGGPMKHYERLVDETIERALERLRQKAHSLGYDGVLGVRIAHPTVVEGGVEIVVYGTGFRYQERAP